MKWLILIALLWPYMAMPSVLCYDVETPVSAGWRWTNWIGPAAPPTPGIPRVQLQPCGPRRVMWGRVYTVQVLTVGDQALFNVAAPDRLTLTVARQFIR